MQDKSPTGAAPTPLPVRHLNQVELARRWSISPRTLERWRWRKQGPSYMRLGGRVAYKIGDVEAFEAAALHVVQRSQPTAKGGR